MIDRTLNYILEGKRFKTLGAGRTDAMVSAEEAAFELFLYHKIDDTKTFLELFNTNLPQDIRALKIKEVTSEFNIIKDSKIKEYLYVFAHSDKFHPFSAPIMTTILDELDIELMMQGAKLFEGTHYFKSYCYKATETGVFDRTIELCELVPNTIFTANFFPEKTYLLRVKGKGFMRNQIRLMMGTLINLGKGNLTLEDIQASLSKNHTIPIDYIAPASGLILNSVEFRY